MPTASPSGKSVSKKPAVKATKGAEKSDRVAKPAESKPAEAKPAVKEAAKDTAKPVAAKPAAATPKAAAPYSKSAAPAAVPGKPAGPINVDYDGFLAKLTPKDRLNIERHITAVEEVSTKVHAKLWKRLATMMMSMAPHSAKANGQQSMQFYIQDGKYRKQIFAIEDLRDGTIHAYAADAIDEAIKLGLILKPKSTDEPDQFRLPNTTEMLNVERLDGKVSNPAPFFKDMLGWNRRAIHVILPVMADEAIADVTAKLLEMGARKDGAIA
jgi:hypothetical protein